MTRIFFLILLCVSFSATAAETSENFFNDLDKFAQQNPNASSLKASLEAGSDKRFSKALFWTPDLSLSAGKTRDVVKGTSPVESDYWRASASLN